MFEIFPTLPGINVVCSSHSSASLSEFDFVQVWGLDISPDGSKLVAGYSSPQIELFNVQTHKKESHTSERSILQSLGIIAKSTPDRVSGIFFSPGGQIVACVGAKSIEFLRQASIP